MVRQQKSLPVKSVFTFFSKKSASLRLRLVQPAQCLTGSTNNIRCRDTLVAQQLSQKHLPHRRQWCCRIRPPLAPSFKHIQVCIRHQNSKKYLQPDSFLWQASLYFLSSLGLKKIIIIISSSIIIIIINIIIILHVLLQNSKMQLCSFMCFRRIDKNTFNINLINK